MSEMSKKWEKVVVNNVELYFGAPVLQVTQKKCPKCKNNLLKVDPRGEMLWCSRCDLLFFEDEI